MANDDDAADVPARRPDKLVTAMMATAAGIAVLSMGVIATRLMKPPPSEAIEVLQLAANQYIEGKPVVAGELAGTVSLGEAEGLPPEVDEEVEEPVLDEEAQKKADEEAADLAKWRTLQNFLIGAGILKRSESADDDRQRRQLQKQAAERLVSARDGGFPPGRTSEGNRMLGEVWFGLGRFNDATEPLRAAIDSDPSQTRELLPVYAVSLRRSLPPRPAEALTAIDEFLSDPSIQKVDRWKGKEIRLETLSDLGRWPEAEKEIADAMAIEPPIDSGERLALVRLQDNAALMKGVIEVRKMADQVAAGQAPTSPTIREPSDPRTPAPADPVQSTIEHLAEVQRQTPPRTALRARLWSARARLLSGDTEGALNDLTLVRQQRPFTAVGILAGLEEVELLADQNRGVEVVQTARYMMREIGDEDGYDPSMVSLDEFRSRMMSAIERLRNQGGYAGSIDTAGAMLPLFSQAEALIQEGLSYFAWAEAGDVADQDGDRDRGVAKITRTRYRAAGEAFENAAEELFGTTDYVATQWSAIEAYQKGRFYSHSIELLRPYLRYEDRRRQSRGLLAMARALLAEGKPEEAIDYLQQCIVEHPRDPLLYNARLIAAQTLDELHRDEEASEMLRANLQDGALTPASPAWRDSLFALGALMFRRGSELHLRYEKDQQPISPNQARENSKVLAEAVRSLNEAVQRYWPSQQAQMASYWVARCHRLVAEEERIESLSPDILEAARRSLLSSAEGNLQSALVQYENLADHLSSLEDEARLDDMQRRLLRNCLMSHGDVLRELQRYEEAATAYRLLELRYINTPTALESIMRRSDCVRALGRRAEADRLVQQAELVLSRIPEDLDSQFVSITRYDRDRWTQYLRWRTQRIEAQNPTG